VGIILINVASGRIEFANDEYARMRGLNRKGADLVGAALEEILPAGFATECIELDRRAHREQRAIMMHTSFRGRAEIQTIRPLSEGLIHPSSSPTVLVTIRVAVPGQDAMPTTVMAAGPSTGENAGDLVVRAKHQDLGPVGSLTTRELQILRLIGEGLTTAQIAARLFRSAKTVEWHRMVIGRKLGAKNRVELARIAISAGLVDSR
jgi:DNA-binding NarL/FixJ family response regulator